jgi:hypothetical protein
MKIAFTGARRLTKTEVAKVNKDLCYSIADREAEWHVGDADVKTITAAIERQPHRPTTKNEPPPKNKQRPTNQPKR